MSNRRYTQFYNTLHTKPIQVDCKFTVAPADSGGLGITGLKGPGISNVFMHTSSTPAGGNPNPANGLIYVQFQDNYNEYYFGGFQIGSPNSGSSISISGSSVMTVGAVYTITAVGTSTTANWVAVGLPVGITPAVGVSFLASVTGGGTGTGTVQAPAAAGSTILDIDTIGNPLTTLQSKAGSIMGVGGSSYLILRCLAATNSSTTTLVSTAPATGSVIRLSFVLSGSSIFNKGD